MVVVLEQYLELFVPVLVHVLCLDLFDEIDENGIVVLLQLLQWKVFCALLHAPTVAGVWLMDFTDLHESLGCCSALGVASDVTNVLTVLGDAPLLLTATGVYLYHGVCEG